MPTVVLLRSAGLCAHAQVYSRVGVRPTASAVRVRASADLCEDPQCLAKKFVVFQTEQEHKRHNAQEHGGNMSKAQVETRSSLLTFLGSAPRLEPCLAPTGLCATFAGPRGSARISDCVGEGVLHDAGC